LGELGFSGSEVLNELGSAKLLIDLTDRTFKQVAPPIEAKKWDGDLKIDGSWAQ
jgi:hypothetical protein